MIMITTFFRSASIEAQAQFYRDLGLDHQIDFVPLSWLIGTSVAKENELCQPNLGNDVPYTVKLGHEILDLIPRDTLHLHLDFFTHFVDR